MNQSRRKAKNRYLDALLLRAKTLDRGAAVGRPRVRAVAERKQQGDMWMLSWMGQGQMWWRKRNGSERRRRSMATRRGGDAGERAMRESGDAEATATLKLFLYGRRGRSRFSV
ncbi:hypothetical protein Cni_G25317 [Canna indica]|uniref:Uncharacterized protein n=1 Tax=Canna indica TaxID=4628 RepID=A0AAQ3QQD0_9LILI|nr:hypothetical protein Cni_G25317 [Canna indica]